MAPSLINLALDVLKTSPSVTLEPATFPALETLNISSISADPTTFSLISLSSYMAKHQCVYYLHDS